MQTQARANVLRQPVEPTGAFPTLLHQVPPEQQLPEVLGVSAGGLGLGALIVFIGYAAQLIHVGVVGHAWKFAAGSAVVAVGGVAIELLRRRKPLTLVPRGPEVGVYRDGQLVSTCSRNQLTFYQLRWTNTVREVLPFGVFGVFATLGALMSLLPATSGLFATWTWGTAIACDAIAYSSVLTRIMSKQYYLPNGLASGAVAFRKSALQRVGWDH